jgi:hypothetical protein
VLMSRISPGRRRDDEFDLSTGSCPIHDVGWLQRWGKGESWGC